MLPPVVDNGRYTLAEAAKLTGLTSRALARRIERGSLPAEKEGGRRYVKLRDLAAAGLLDLATGQPPEWTRSRLDPGRLTQAILDELSSRGVRIYELERRVQELSSEVQEQQRVNEKQHRELRKAARERAELRRQIELRKRRT
jgi:hypothetical protein